MPPTASIIVPTQRRAAYLDVALASIAPQAAAAGAELIVVDDGPDDDTRKAAVRHGARYVPHGAPRGLNAARNTGIAAAGGELLVFVDDDVEVSEGWLAALLSAHANEPEDVGAFAGPIHARFEDHALRMCGREGPPVTFLDLGGVDRDAPNAWGANMTVRRAWVDRVGPFDARMELYGDEQEWQQRLKQAGGRIRYVAGAALDHRRAGDDARLRSLCRAAASRGRASRRYDLAKGLRPPLGSELRTLAGCLLHAPRYRCANGFVMAAHSWGRVRETLRPQKPAAPQTDGDDFLSGRSGHVAGRRGFVLRVRDRLFDVAGAGRSRRLDRAAADRPAGLRVHVIAIDRPGSVLPAAVEELRRSRHEVSVQVGALRRGVGKFERLGQLLAEAPAERPDWLLVLDDDVVLPAGFLDRFLLCAEDAGLKLAQPAHRLHSHAAWPVTRRRARSSVRETHFVEIGPVTAFRHDTFPVLLPLPALRMGWGLDVHWSAVAAERGWRIGVVDATPILHLNPVADGYGHAGAIEEARAFLVGKPYVTRDEALWSQSLDAEIGRAP